MPSLTMAMISEGMCPMCRGSKKNVAISENVKIFSYPCLIKRQRQVRTRRARSPAFVLVAKKLKVMIRRSIPRSLLVKCTQACLQHGLLSRGPFTFSASRYERSVRHIRADCSHREPIREESRNQMSHANNSWRGTSAQATENSTTPGFLQGGSGSVQRTSLDLALPASLAGRSEDLASQNFEEG